MGKTTLAITDTVVAIIGTAAVVGYAINRLHKWLKAKRQKPINGASSNESADLPSDMKETSEQLKHA